jgi:hypothetical protein
MPKRPMPKRKSAAKKAVKGKKPAHARKTTPARPANAAHDQSLREHVLVLLRGGHAHADFEKTIADFPPELRGEKPHGLPYNAWQLLEHLRIAQWDIVEFSHDAKHVSPDWPSGYWPESDTPPDPAAWDKSLADFRRDFEKMERLVSNPKADLHAPIPGGHGYTVLREALLLADHNAYHLGQLLILRRLLGAWHE